MPAKYVIAIDPGTTQSGVCIVRTEDYRPLWVAKLENRELCSKTLDKLEELHAEPAQWSLVIERMYNPKAASSHVFLTCEWIGRFDFWFKSFTPNDTDYIYRYEEYRFLCGKEYARNDKGIRAALVDRFAYGMPSFGKGNKKNPGWFYGFAADSWSAYAVAVTYLDREGL